MHIVIVTDGIVQKVVKRGGEKFAVLADPHSYNTFLIPNNQYFQGQTVSFEGQIVATEKASGYIRLMGTPKPPTEYET